MPVRKYQKYGSKKKMSPFPRFEMEMKKVGKKENRKGRAKMKRNPSEITPNTTLGSATFSFSRDLKVKKTIDTYMYISTNGGLGKGNNNRLPIWATRELRMQERKKIKRTKEIKRKRILLPFHANKNVDRNKKKKKPLV